MYVKQPEHNKSSQIPHKMDKILLLCGPIYRQQDRKYPFFYFINHIPSLSLLPFPHSSSTLPQVNSSSVSLLKKERRKEKRVGLIELSNKYGLTKYNKTWHIRSYHGRLWQPRRGKGFQVEAKESEKRSTILSEMCNLNVMALVWVLKPQKNLHVNKKVMVVSSKLFDHFYTLFDSLHPNTSPKSILLPVLLVYFILKA